MGFEAFQLTFSNERGIPAIMVKRASKPAKNELVVPSIYNWNTTDTDEINRRRLRAQTESFVISNLDALFPVFSNFRVKSGSGLSYVVEIRDLSERQFGCTCVDFRINGLGTCKHVEAVLNHLQARYRRLLKNAQEQGSARIDILPDTASNSLRAVHRLKRLPRALSPWFDEHAALRVDSVERALDALQALREKGLPQLRQTFCLSKKAIGQPQRLPLQGTGGSKGG
jgi:hypothetical protein